MSETAQPSRDLWAGVDALIDRAPSLADLRSHQLHLLAARRWRQRGIEVPAGLAVEELIAVDRTASAQRVLRIVREACEGRILVVKGPSVAARYPTPDLRPSVDLDILVEDPDALQRTLLAAGWEPIGPYAEAHYDRKPHLRPLKAPGVGAPWIEVHRRLNWVDWADPPGTRELLSVAVEGGTGVAGMLELPPEYHALALAAHSWGEMPLRRILDLVDISLLTSESDHETICALARRWGIDRMWHHTDVAARALLFGAPDPWTLRTWARNLPEVRTRTVRGTHVRRWASPFWAFPVPRALAESRRAIVKDFRPMPTETWRSKLARVGMDLRYPTRPHLEQVPTRSEGRRQRTGNQPS